MNPFKFLIILVVSFLFLIIIGGFYFYTSIAWGLPSFETLENPKQDYATQVLSSDGVLLDHIYRQRRVVLPFDSIPPNFINALIATEDKDFYSHWGVYARRILNATIKNLLALRLKEGSSTLTMQLARNLFFTHEVSLERKLKEAITAVLLEKTYTKKEILEMYINTVGFGRGTYGLQVASEVYFNKEPKELTLSECAFLVALLKAPEHYNGLINYEKAIERRNLVLSLMKEQNYISEDEYIKAVDVPIVFAKTNIYRKPSTLIAPHFVEMVRAQLGKDLSARNYDIYSDGLIIKTTLNSKIQLYTKQAVEEHLKIFQNTFNRSFNWSKNTKLLEDLISKAVKNYPKYFNLSESERIELERRLKRNKNFVDSVKNVATTIQVGVIVLDAATGEILAMIGASPKFMEDHPDSKYSLNHVTQIKRQPGSSFKPFVYAAALDDGLDINSQVECGPFSYRLPSGEVWSPRGHSDCEPGETVTLSKGLAASINTVAARLITEYTTPDKVITIAKRMGIQSQLRAFPSLSLGAAGEVSPYEMAAAFTGFANEGTSVSPYYINSIEDQWGNVIQTPKIKSFQNDALKSDIAQKMTKLMMGVINGGTGYEVKKYLKNCEAAGKTGTTNDYADAWFVGYTPQLVCAVWVGFDDRRITFTGDYAYASKAAAPIFGRIMAKIYNDPQLPYKQTKFVFSLSENTDSLTAFSNHSINDYLVNGVVYFQSDLNGKVYFKKSSINKIPLLFIKPKDDKI